MTVLAAAYAFVGLMIAWLMRRVELQRFRARGETSPRTHDLALDLRSWIAAFVFWPYAVLYLIELACGGLRLNRRSGQKRPGPSRHAEG